MRAYDAVIVVCSIFFGLLPHHAKGAAKKKKNAEKPALIFDIRSHDFGAVTQGEKKTYSFKFKNQGPDPIRILGLHTSCGCAATNLKKLTYAPNEEGLLPITLDTTAFLGPIDKSVFLMTSQDKAAYPALHLKATIKPEFIATPPVLDFGTYKKTGPNPPTLTFKLTAKNNHAILKPIYNSELFTLQHEIKDGVLLASLDVNKDALKNGRLRETIYLETASDTLPHFPIPVVMEVLGAVSHKPEYLDFGQLTFAGQRKKTLTLKSQKPFQITSVKSDAIVNGEPVTQVDEMIYVESSRLDKAEKTKRIKILVKNKLNTYAGVFRGHVLFELENPKDTIKVDLYGLLLAEKEGRRK